MIKLSNWKSVIAFTMGLSLYLYITILLFFPYTPIQIHGIKIVNQGDSVCAGGDLIYEIDYTKHTEYPVTQVSRQLIDGYIILLASKQHSSFPTGRHKKLVYAKVPDFASAGEYTLHISATYQVNLLRTVTVTADSPKFQIRKKW
jgi:hypothetical protein